MLVTQECTRPVRANSLLNIDRVSAKLLRIVNTPISKVVTRYNILVNKYLKRVREFINLYIYLINVISLTLGSRLFGSLEQSLEEYRTKMDSVENSVGFDGANIQNYIGDNEAARVEAVYEFIANECKNAPLSFYNCVLDPNSFSRTVENIYYISMLVHQERVAIYLHDTYQIPFLRVLEPRPLHENVDNRIDGLGANEESNPVVVSIDMDQWKKLIDAFGIKEAKMKID